MGEIILSPKPRDGRPLCHRTNRLYDVYDHIGVWFGLRDNLPPWCRPGGVA